MSTVTAWRTDEPCPVCATGLIDMHDDGTTPVRWLSAVLACEELVRHLDEATTWTEVTSATEATVRASTRAQRMAMPLGPEGGPGNLAVEHGACIRPIQLRRTNLDTGEADTVLVPCGHTLAHVCPSCAERARTLRAAQCRDGWHLRGRTRHRPRPGHRRPAVLGREGNAPKPSSSATRPRPPDRTPPTWTSSSRELDEEITKRRHPREGLPSIEPRLRRHRSTRRRQDARTCPGRKVRPADGGQDLHRAGRQDDLPPVAVRSP